MQAPLKDTSPLKFQKSSVPRKYTTSKFSNPPPKIRGVHTLNFFDCQRIFLCLMVFCILKKPFHPICHSDNSLKAGYFDVFHSVVDLVLLLQRYPSFWFLDYLRWFTLLTFFPLLHCLLPGTQDHAAMTCHICLALKV